MVVFDDGLYGQTGRDVKGIQELTLLLLREVFGVTDVSRVKITLVPEG